MSSDTIDLRWLKVLNCEGSESGEGPMLRQAIRTLLALDRTEDDPFPGALGSGDPVDELAIEETTPLDRPTLVLTAMPPPAARGQKAVDILLHSSGIRLLLVNPLAFVVFVTPLPRAVVDEELHRWVSYGSPHRVLAARSPYRQLATTQLVGWAFLTVDELTGCRDTLRRRREQLEHLTRSVATDPSGLRSLLHLMVGEGTIPERHFASLPPRYALVVDDEEETAARLSALVRRWGYSVLTIDRPAAWRWVRSGELDLGHHFELALVDNVLGFEGAPLREGHAWLRSLAIRHKIFKTGARDRLSLDGEIHIGPEVADGFQLLRACRTVHPEWEPQGVLFRANAISTLPDLHSDLRGLVIGIGHRLMAGARRFEAEAPRLAALHLLEAFSLVERLDGPLAAGAYSKLQEFEVETLCERAPGVLDCSLLEMRLAAIRQGIERCFNSDDRTEIGNGQDEGILAGKAATEATAPDSQGRDRGTGEAIDVRSRIDAGLWISRTLGRLENTLRRYPISARLHQILEIERRAQRLRNQRLLTPGAASWTAWIPALWNRLSRHMISLHRVAMAWLLVVLVFGIFFAWREAVSLGVPLDARIWARGLGASLSCGLGFLYPHVYGFGIPAAELYCFEFVQRSLAVVFLARAVELGVGWLRYGS